ncbi:SRPBCC domain-containing protein [Streptomyces sp. NPDC059991]|uniref:SRPBCC domain-containing protein n=1 Tax=unclassified Streptomyces TaxID=2593676 RepID=UPI00367540B7
MEHEVFVPVEVQSLRQTLRDPARVARCVPGLQQDAGEPPVAGRLKLRVEGHTITYRGTLRITELDEDTFGVEARGTEARGTGAAKFSLTLRLAPEPKGTRLSFTATATADGRVATATPEGARASASRLLDRFGAALAADTEGAGKGAGDAPEADATAPEAEPTGPTTSGSGSGAPEEGAGHSVFDAVVPPPAPDPLAEEESDLPGDADYVPAEAAHARRTMIGRSAEEVDHAPPRGRYAPVPAPAGVGAGATLRWVAPAAALALASAVVVGRVLRRRR